MPKPSSMKSGSLDNFQTDPIALDCLVPFLRKDWLIWEPACGNGNLVGGLDRHDFYVFGTDLYCKHDGLEHGTDFLSEIRDPFDCIVTNPPYSLKEEFLARCYQLGKPFALLMPLTTFDSVERRKLFEKHGVQVIFPRKRINFETPNHERNVAEGKKTSAWFFTAWFCWGLETGGRQLVFDEEKTLI